MSTFTDVHYVERFPTNDDRVVDRIFATAHRTLEGVLFLQVAMNLPQQLNDDALRLAHGMLALGLKPGERVAVQLGNRMEAAAFVTASLAAGEIFVPVNPAYTAAEMDAYPRKCIALQIGSSFSYVD